MVALVIMRNIHREGMRPASAIRVNPCSSVASHPHPFAALDGGQSLADQTKTAAQIYEKYG
jgi:hypothetical protein